MPSVPRVLLVDDNRSFLLAIREAVIAALPDLELATAESAGDALALLEREPYDVVVTDVTMPSMDGLKFLDIVHAQYPETPVILLTGKDDRELAIQALRRGAHDLLTKPVEQVALAASIERGIETSKLRRQLREYQKDLERQVHERTRQLSFLANAGKRLSSSLDYKTTVSELATLVVPELADSCIVHMINLGGQVERVAATHRDPVKLPLIEALATKYPSTLQAEDNCARVLRSGVPILSPVVSLEATRTLAQNEEHERLLLELGVVSSICVPLKLQDAVIGAISIAMSESKRRYNETDLALAEELALRASLAIENAMLYSQSQNEVSQRVRAESDLRESEERFRSMADHAPVLIWVCDSEGKFEYFNRPWLAFRGRTLEEEIAHGWLDGIHPEDRANCVTAHDAAFRERVPFMVEYRLKQHNGGYRWILVHAVPRFGSDRRFEGFIGSGIDITDRKEMEAELVTAKNLAELANKAKDQFLAVLSHELRTPLTPVLNILQIIQEDEKLAEDIKSFVDIAIHNVNLEAKIVNDLLRVTEISAGKLQLTLEPLDLHALIQSVLPVVSKSLKDKSIDLVLELNATQHVVNGDSLRLHQVLGNLLENAVKFTPEHGTIHLTTANNRNTIEVRVRDSGIGIRPELLPKIFDTFEQGDGDIHRQYGGLGLGLAISRGMMELHGGTLQAESDGLGKGTTFMFALTSIDSAVPVAPTKPSYPFSTLPSQRLLVIEDNRHTLQALRTLLERRGFVVDVAETLTDAITRVRAQKYDLVISDLGLPDGSGLDIMPYLNSSHTRAIAVSGFCTESDIQSSRSMGFIDHLAKPFDFKKLHEVIERALHLPVSHRI